MIDGCASSSADGSALLLTRRSDTLSEALKSEAFYVGAIGSRLNNQKRRERLVQFDVSEAQLAKLHGPIGLYIGSKTPAEIAISILAEMTAVKNGIALSDSVRVGGAKQAAESVSAHPAD